MESAPPAEDGASPWAVGLTQVTAERAAALARVGPIVAEPRFYRHLTEGKNLSVIAALPARATHEASARRRYAAVAGARDAMCLAMCRASLPTPPTFSEVNEYRKSRPTK